MGSGTETRKPRPAPCPDGSPQGRGALTGKAAGTKEPREHLCSFIHLLNVCVLSTDCRCWSRVYLVVDRIWSLLSDGLHLRKETKRRETLEPRKCGKSKIAWEPRHRRRPCVAGTQSCESEGVAERSGWRGWRGGSLKRRCASRHQSLPSGCGRITWKACESLASGLLGATPGLLSQGAYGGWGDFAFLVSSQMRP